MVDCLPQNLPPLSKELTMSFTRTPPIVLSLLVLGGIRSVALAQDAPPAAAAAPAAKHRVAVMNFDYGTVKTTVAQIFGSDQDVGKGISDLLVQKLVQD